MRNDAMTQLCSYAKEGELREFDPADEATKWLHERNEARARLIVAEKKLADAERRAAASKREADAAVKNNPGLAHIKAVKKKTKVDVLELQTAGDYLRRGDVPEALVYLERALPASFSGLADRAAHFYRSPA